MHFEKAMKKLNDLILKKKVQEKLGLGKKVLLIMITNKQEQENQKENNLNDIQEFLRQNSNLVDLNKSQQIQESNFLCLPENYTKHQINFHITILEILKQFQNLNEENKDMATAVGKLIKKEYQNYDGFVVYHPDIYLINDATNLSFRLENLMKPVIFLEFQKNMFDSLSQNLDEIKWVLIIAGVYSIPEVCIFSTQKLFRANRVIRDIKNQLASPNYPNLGEIINDFFEVYWENIKNEQLTNNFDFFEKVSKEVIHIQVNPFYNYQFLEKIILEKKYDGIVLESYASGTFPIHNEKFMQLFQKVFEKSFGIKVLQCQTGQNESIYENNIMFPNLIDGNDINQTAAIYKLQYLLSKYDDKSLIKYFLENNMRGEMRDYKINEIQQNIKQSYQMYIKGDEELKNEIYENFVQKNLIFRAFAHNQIYLLINLKKEKILNEKTIQEKNDKNQNLLHVSAFICGQNILKIFQSLMNQEQIKKMANEEDVYGNKPIIYSMIKINKDFLLFINNFTKIENLVNEKNKNFLTTIIFNEIEKNKFDQIKCFYFCGIQNLNQFTNFNQLNIAHFAVFYKNYELLKFLKKEVINFDFIEKDSNGKTPLDYAKERNDIESINILD